MNFNRRHTFDALRPPVPPPKSGHAPRSPSTSSGNLKKPSSSRRDKDRSASGEKEANKKPSRHADVIDSWDPSGLGSARESYDNPRYELS
jgi:hypothetical protein